MAVHGSQSNCSCPHPIAMHVGSTSSQCTTLCRHDGSSHENPAKLLHALRPDRAKQCFILKTLGPLSSQPATVSVTCSCPRGPADLNRQQLRPASSLCPGRDSDAWRSATMRQLSMPCRDRQSMMPRHRSGTKPAGMQWRQAGHMHTAD